MNAVASDRGQARLIADSIAGFVARTESLHDALEVQESRVIAPSTGAVLEILASDLSSVWGLRIDFLIYDEICQHVSTPKARGLYEAVFSALPKKKNSRAAIITTSGDPVHWSRRVYDNAIRSPIWRVSESHDLAPWIDKSLVEEERLSMPEASYRRLWLNEWSVAEDRAFVREDILACVRSTGPRPPEENRRDYVLAVDLGETQDPSAACVMHVETGSDRRRVFVVDRLDVWTPTKDNKVRLGRVQQWIEDTYRAYRARRVIGDDYQFGLMAEQLNAKNIKTIRVRFTLSSQQ